MVDVSKKGVRRWLVDMVDLCQIFNNFQTSVTSSAHNLTSPEPSSMHSTAS